MIILKKIKGKNLASGFFALLDDISMLMDSTANMAKSAAKNTAGVLGDDLAVNAAKASNFGANRELPVLWAIVKGSFLNKIVIIPIILALSYYLPTVVDFILLIGAAYLAYEGAEAIWEYLFPKAKEHKESLSEKEKIKSAILTDFILSIEIVLIALASVYKASFFQKALIVTIVAFGATIGVYSIVAFFVRLDDMGFALARGHEKRSLLYRFGMFLVWLLPFLIRVLSVVGVIAMLLVAGGIFMHHFFWLEDIAKELKLPTIIMEFLSSVVVGAVVMGILSIFSFLKKKI